MSENHSIQHSSFFIKYRFWLIFICAAVVLEIPFVSIPLKWFESYFHEISHGLLAIISGGEIIRIQLFPNGAGLCTTRGGSNFLVSFFGYAGAVIWGVLIYWLSTLHQKIAQLISLLIGLLLILTMVFWIRDPLSLFIVLVLLAIVLLTFKLQNSRYFQMLLQLIGATVLLNSIKSPWYLLDGRSLGDGAALAQITFIPEIFWIGIWFALGLMGIVMLAKTNSQ